MARNRHRPSATFPLLPMAAVPAIDMGPYVRMTADLVAQSSRLWVDLWFRNLNHATDVFWADVRTRNAAR